jgi:Glycosyl hydrolase family 65 central catalytic domain
MELPANYYHCFLGNGLDAVLIGYTGSMVADKVGVDRCVWYKSDRYYPETKLIQVAGRFPLDRPLEHAAGSGWYEIAPLGRTWYEVIWQGQPLSAQASQQRFVPQEGSLYSRVDYGPVQVDVTTFLHATRSLLVEHYVFSQEVEFRGWLGPGVWVEEGWDTDPFLSVSMSETAPEGQYDLGETKGRLALRTEPSPTAGGAQGRDRWVSVRGQTLTKYFSILDNRQGMLDTAALEQARALGYLALRQEQLAFWQNYFSASSIRLPADHAWAQSFYEASQYHFKAMQNPVSGGLPVNNLRRTWSSHIFWDSYFIQRALLEANHRAEALEACRFFQRTLDQARRHAQEEFGCEGLKWDWEITHDGRKAYGVLLHMKDQVHNNASYANELWNYYTFTQDLDMLREFYPILEGLAQFFLHNVVEKTAHGYETRPVVGVHESPIRVRNDGITVTGAIVILQRAAEAARLLGRETDFTRECATVADNLTQTLDRLYNGRFFTSSEGSDSLNMSSLAPMYPMQVVAYDDPRAVQTARAFLERYEGRPVGHGGSEAGFPWAAGVLATVFARQGEGDMAWSIIESTRPTICSFGGMTEVMADGQWNMQYFGTAQAAVCTAIHNLLLQDRGGAIHLFPALPAGWQEVEFEHLLAAGVTVSARLTAAGGTPRVHATVRNISRTSLTRELWFNQQAVPVTLQPDEEQSLQWTR